MLLFYLLAHHHAKFFFLSTRCFFFVCSGDTAIYLMVVPPWRLPLFFSLSLYFIFIILFIAAATKHWAIQFKIDNHLVNWICSPEDNENYQWTKSIGAFCIQALLLRQFRTHYAHLSQNKIKMHFTYLIAGRNQGGHF